MILQAEEEIEYVIFIIVLLFSYFQPLVRLLSATDVCVLHSSLYALIRLAQRYDHFFKLLKTCMKHFLDRCSSISFGVFSSCLKNLKS